MATNVLAWWPAASNRSTRFPLTRFLWPSMRQAMRARLPRAYPPAEYLRVLSMTNRTRSGSFCQAYFLANSFEGKQQLPVVVGFDEVHQLLLRLRAAAAMPCLATSTNPRNLR